MKPILCCMTMDSHDAVRIRGLRKSYGELTALDGVDLTVARGMELEHLTVARPTLEDVYLDLTEEAA